MKLFPVFVEGKRKTARLVVGEVGWTVRVEDKHVDGSITISQVKKSEMIASTPSENQRRFMLPFYYEGEIDGERHVVFAKKQYWTISSPLSVREKKRETATLYPVDALTLIEWMKAPHVNPADPLACQCASKIYICLEHESE